MQRWIVQKWVPMTDRDLRHWEDIVPRHLSFAPTDFETSWEALSAGEAFQAAVIQNPDVRMEATSYRVLSYTGGATFNLSLNLEAADHGS